MHPPTRQPRTKRALIALAAFAGIAAADLICIQLFGQAPWVLDYLTSIALLSAAALGIFVLPLLLADWLARRVRQSYRTWIWIALAVLFASAVMLAVSLVLQQSDLLI